ncbi:metallophosphoesterase family protein [Mycolicibacterium sp.]|uniref:metallophosphoesterase family protein n=1 Tax=Mycolicibacterium sp. TaxID=2320850 RepID=UPI0037C67451
MIEQFLNRDFMLAVTEGARTVLNKETSAHQRRGKKSPLDDYSSADLHELEEALGQAAAELGAPEPVPAAAADAPPPREDHIFLPHNQLMAILQSALEQAIAEHDPGKVSSQSPAAGRRRGGATPAITGSSLKGVELAPTVGNRRVWKKMEIATGKWAWLSDPRWALSLVNKIWRDACTGSHPFVDNPATIKVANDAVIIVIGDWGSGLPRARLVADQVAKELARDPHRQKVVIHLGDVYYSGTEREFRERFLDPWPVPKGSDVVSLTIPGNHELYSGGFAYFDVGLTDPRFARQQGCSYFAVETDHWQFLGLDTAYQDAGLFGGQTGWARDRIVNAPPDMRTCLLSHHQLFSAHENKNHPLRTQIEPVLATERVDAWLWGHEHRCIQYAPTTYNGHRLGFASCIGHGGVPEYLVMKEGQTAPAPWEYEYLKRFSTGLEPWGMFGFAVLDLHDERLDVRYIDEAGHEHHRVDQVGVAP